MLTCSAGGTALAAVQCLTDPSRAPGTAGLVGLAVLVLSGLAYLRAVRRSPGAWRHARTAAWLAGLVTAGWAVAGPPGAEAGRQVWVLTVQVVVLLLVAPVLLAYGRPVLLATRVHGGRALPPVGRAVLRAASNPLLGPVVVPVLLAGVFFTPVLPAVLHHSAARATLQGVLLVIGLLLAMGLVGDDEETASSSALGAAVAVGFGELLLDAVPGIVLRLQTHLLAGPAWVAAHGGARAALHDQQRAGAILWFVAEAADLPFLAVLTRRWIRADTRDADRIDAELDLRSAAEPATGSGTEAPWWETDPGRLGGHRVARQHTDDSR